MNIVLARYLKIHADSSGLGRKRYHGPVRPRGLQHTGFRHGEAVRGQVTSISRRWKSARADAVKE